MSLNEGIGESSLLSVNRTVEGYSLANHAGGLWGEGSCVWKFC
jgi:hypothetical protein